jgi:hypothetical protein
LRFGLFGMKFRFEPSIIARAMSDRSLAHYKEAESAKPAIWRHSNAVAKPSMLSFSLAKADAMSIAMAT